MTKRIRTSKGRYQVKRKKPYVWPTLQCRHKGCPVMFWEEKWRDKHEREFHK